MSERPSRVLLAAGAVALAGALGLGGWWMFRAPAKVTCDVRPASVACTVAPRGREGERVRICWSVRVLCANGAGARVWSCARTRVGKPAVQELSLAQLRDGRGAGTCDRPTAASVRRVRKKPYEDEE